MPLGFKYFDNGQKLIVVSFVSSLGRNHFSQIVGHQVPLAQVGKLTQYTADSVTWRVGFNPDMTFRIKISEYQNFDERLP